MYKKKISPFIAHCNTIVGATGHTGSLYLPNALIKALEGKTSTSIPPATGRLSVAPCPAGVTWRGWEIDGVREGLRETVREMERERGRQRDSERECWEVVKRWLAAGCLAVRHGSCLPLLFLDVFYIFVFSCRSSGEVILSQAQTSTSRNVNTNKPASNASLSHMSSLVQAHWWEVTQPCRHRDDSTCVFVKHTASFL